MIHLNVKIVESTILVFLLFACFSCSERPLNRSVEEQQERLMPDDPNYIEWQLSIYGLQKLNEEGAIRFLWMRSFHPVIVFDLRQSSENALEYEARLWNGKKWNTFSKKIVSTEGWAPSINLLELYGFFEAPHFTVDEFKFADGSTTIIEAYTKGKYNWMLKGNILESKIEGEWAQRLIEESINSPVVPIY